MRLKKGRKKETDVNMKSGHFRYEMRRSDNELEKEKVE